MTKVLRIDLQQSSCVEIFNSKKELRNALIDVGTNEYPRKKLKSMSLNQLCRQFDYHYRVISDKQAEQIERKEMEAYS